MEPNHGETGLHETSRQWNTDDRGLLGMYATSHGLGCPAVADTVGHGGTLWDTGPEHAPSINQLTSRVADARHATGEAH